MRQRIANLLLALFALPALALAEPASQPTSKPALSHILVQTGGMIGSQKTDISPDGLFVRETTSDLGKTVKTVRHSLTPWERLAVARIAQRTIDAPGEAKEVTDYYQDITIGSFNVRQHAIDARFAKLFDILNRLEVIANKESH